jgi:Na+-driven multidrug efflux pump
MGVAGVARATIISQTVSAILSYRILLTTKDVYKVSIKKIHFDTCIIKQMLKVGLPSGLQNSVISFANIVVQANINSFGAVAMAGSGAFSRVQGFVFIPVTSFALSLTTFTSQNIGAGEYDRVKKGARFGIITAMILSELIGIALLVKAPQILSLFSKDVNVIAIGVLKAQYSCPFLLFMALSHVMAGVYRGAGKSIVPMMVMFLVWCVFRVAFITVALSLNRDIRILFAAYPITWFMSAVIFVIYYFKVDWMGIDKLKIVE